MFGFRDECLIEHWFFEIANVGFAVRKAAFTSAPGLRMKSASARPVARSLQRSHVQIPLQPVFSREVDDRWGAFGSVGVLPGPWPPTAYESSSGPAGMTESGTRSRVGT